ncbi:MAG TPA: AmmeMemoRadiSam system protein B, partial [Candidatus Ozemobacteraceae bacterium]|nr:AmmeMemoRadiSam system protein B [Candidatus Ozemobacteraceae bacterium]
MKYACVLLMMGLVSSFASPSRVWAGEGPWGLRAPAVAGQFYPGTADELKAAVSSYLTKAKPPFSCASESRVVALIVPHAGYVFSGATAGLGFRALENVSFDRYCFLGVDHRSGLSTISVWPDGGFDTPLGPAPVDGSFTRRLLENGPPVTAESSQHVAEHSIEVLVPFFQVVFEGKSAT